MVKKALFILTLFIAFCANAATVSVSTAQIAAVNFFKVTAKNISDRTPVTATLKYTKTETDNTIDFYVFDINPVKGFVIISADDNVKPVIAYSTETYFKIPAQGTSVQCWITHAGTNIHNAIQRKVTASQTISNQWSAYLQGQKPANAKSLNAGVAPLISTNWDQEPYYNQLCPYNATDSMRTVTGCVATAMAQIMKYWNYPVQGTGEYGYLNAPPTCFNTYGDQYANFGATTYNWAAMPDTLSSNNIAVATLMYHCGVAVAMDYGDDDQGGSGSYVLAADVAGWRHNAQMAYTTYFGYNANTLQGVYESDYNSADWVNLMEGELNAGRPVQYVGTDPNAGSHTWVCDGYDANDMLHMNWGWSGLDNGYYSISSLTADGYNFSTHEEALIGIEPANNLSVSATVANAAICSGSSTTLSAQGNSANVSYTWTPATGLSCSTCATTMASPAATTVYTVSIDSAGLSAITQVTVTVNAEMNMDSTSVTNVACFGADNGKITIEVSGGTPGYKYLWNTGDSSASVSGLAAGNYSATVTDANGCTISTVAAIVQPDSMVAGINAANTTCSLNNASLNADVQGGTPAYSFFWSSGENTSSVSSLIAGEYTVTVLDASGCSVSTSVVVAQPAAINVSIVSSNTACSLLYAIAAANVTGGSGNLLFNWSNGENTNSISNLSAGNFSVTVTDSLGCSSSASQTFVQPDSMSVSIAASEATDNTVYGKAVAIVTGGTPQYSYLWNTGAVTAEISDLTAGVYSVTITDNKGCSQKASAIVSETTGIGNSTNSLNFDVYPNPAATSITVQLGATGNEETTLEVKNMLGQTLMAQKVTDMQSRIDLSDRANGVYFIVLTRGQEKGVKEIVIQK